MASNIDPAVPPLGNATTSGVRNNFAHAKTEIEALQTSLAALQAQMTALYAGFVDYTNVTLAWNNGTRTFTISPVTGSFSFYAAGALFSKAAPQSVVIPDVTGNYYFYFDAAGVLQYATAFSNDMITRFAFAAEVYWNATTNLAVPDAMIEMHTYEVPPAVHLYLHEVIGTAYDKENNGLTPSITVDADGSLAAHIQASLTSGAIWDDAVRQPIGSKLITDTIPILYKTGAGAEWTFNESGSTFVLPAGTGRAAWNQFTGGAWQLTEVTNNNYVLMHLFAIPGFTKKWMLVVGRAEYATIALARAAALTEVKSIVVHSDPLPLPEHLEIATFVIQTSNTYTNASKSRFVSADVGVPFVDWRW